jgi:tRNA modification GTPase
LFELLVRVEAGLDHPEEDITAVAKDEALALAATAEAAISSLAETFARGRLVAEGARVALVGRPNAGKSSLLNALLGRERAIVCAEPGTTRDTLEESAELSGAPAVLIDTAGFRERCADAAEAIGLERAEIALETADVALLVVDGSRPENPEDGRVHERIRAAAAARGRPLISVVNKADALASCWEGQPGLLRVSAKNATGLGELSGAVAAELSRDGGPADEGALVTSARHHEALSRAAAALARAGKLSGPWEDRFARDLREAISALGEIDGATTTEDLLGAVFSKFCVGK